jgi:hypothetical protein
MVTVQINLPVLKIHRFIKRIGITLCLLAFLQNSKADEIKLTATVNKNPVGTNEQFTLTYTLNTNGGNFTPPVLKDFNVLSGPNQSTSMQFINGAMSQSITLTYYLQARSEGTFKIEPGSIEVNGVKIKSNALTLTVIKGQAKAQNNNQQNDESDNAISANSIFLKVSVDKTNLYRGEALIATYKLYTRVNIINYAIEKLPAFNGFWSQELKMPEQLELHNETLNGQQYRVGIIKKIVLFPQQAGILTLEPMEGSCIARIQNQRKRSNNPFDIFNDPFFSDPFFGSARDVKASVKSEPLKINVKELPPSGDPAFSGSVGSFNLQASLDKNQVKANDAVNLKIKITGRGNLKLIEAPKINLPTDIESYEPKVNDNISVSEAGVSGNKTFEYLLIPRHEGDFTIDPILFTFFDLGKKEYVQLRSSEFKLNVKGITGDAAAAQSVLSYQNKSDIKLLGKDIRFIKTSPLTNYSNGVFFGSFWFYVLMFLPIFLVFLLWMYKKRKDSLQGNVAYVRSNRATKLAKKRLSIAKKELDNNKIDIFYEEIFKALYGYASDKLSIDLVELTKEKLAARLTAKNISETTVQNLFKTIETCEYARFASQTNNGNPHAVYEDAIKIITELENQFH